MPSGGSQASDWTAPLAKLAKVAEVAAALMMELIRAVAEVAGPEVAEERAVGAEKVEAVASRCFRTWVA